MIKILKNVIVSTLGVVALLFTATSCNSRAKLVESIQGVWSGNPENVVHTDNASASIVRVLDFSTGGTDTEGVLVMKALITVDKTIAKHGVNASPMNISVQGSATITGNFQAVDDDDLVVVLDRTSLKVDVDSQNVVVNYTPDAGNTQSAEMVRKEALIIATQQIKNAAHKAFSNFSTIEDVRIDGNMLKCEIGDRDLVLSKTSGK